MYDLIGDIHGYASTLKKLLEKMGYQEQHGAWQHPERKVIFLGDFIDRGPEQVEVVRIAKAMVDGGHALSVMGNHEYNAVVWSMPDSQNPDQFLRPHSDKNLSQHQAFLDQVGEGSELYWEFIDWFKQLPLFLDLPEFRVVHACWHPQYLSDIEPYLDHQNRLLPQSWEATARKGSEAYEALEILLKGLEISLPAGQAFSDKQGHSRTKVRTRWWDEEAITYRELALVPTSVINEIPHIPAPSDIVPGYDGKKPVFVGHYWFKGKPTPLDQHVACLDYSVVDSHGGKLCAYRFSGEPELDPAGFCWVSR